MQPSDGMIKLIHSSAFDNTVDVGARLIEDPRQLTKSAATIFDCDYSDLIPDKDHLGIHLVALGDFEHFGCFFAGAPVQTLTGIVPIEQVKVGDMALTHKNRFRKVITTFEDLYTGVRVDLEVVGLPHDISCTSNHPFLVVRAERCTPHMRFDRRAAGTLEAWLDELAESAEPVAANQIHPGDYLVAPCNPESISEDIKPVCADPYVMGLYVAEGCLAKEYRAITTIGEYKTTIFTLSDNDRNSIDYLQKWATGDGIHNAVSELKSYTSEKGIRLQYGNKEFAEYLDNTFGHLCNTKRIHPNIFSLSVEAKLNFLAGYFDGDGCADKSESRPRYLGTLKASTVSLNLAMDLQRLAASVGIPMSVSLCYNYDCNRVVEGFGKGQGDLPIYALSIGCRVSNRIIQYCKRLLPHTKETKVGGAHQHTSGKYLLSPVRKVTQTQVENVYKYNIEVEEDHTYVVLSQAVMNSNRNGDSFPKTACIKYHDTFVKHGNVYRHHRNKDPEKRLGQVVKSAYNEPMGRIELFIHAHKEKAQDELEKLARDGEVAYSMACFPAGTLITLPDSTEQPIETLTVAQSVLTHTGAIGSVSATMERDYEGDMVELAVAGLPDKLTATGNHKIHILPCKRTLIDTLRICPVCDSQWKNYQALIAHARQQMDEKHNRFVLDPCAYLEGWKESRDIKCGDLVRTPIRSRLGEATESIEFAELLGWYLAEGSTFNYSSAGIDFSLHKKETDYAARITALVNIVEPAARINIYRHNKNGQVVRVVSPSLRLKLMTYGGQYSWAKKLNPSVMAWPVEHKRSLVSAFFSGDGCWNKINRRASATIVSRVLAKQLVDILLGCGIPVSLAAYQSKQPNKRRAYVIELSNTNAPWLTWNKGQCYTPCTYHIAKGLKNIVDGTILHWKVSYGSRVIIKDNYVYRPVRSIRKYTDTLKVYNCSVEGDHSYVANEIGVSNCRVPGDRCSRCNTIRKSASDPKQCDHVRDELGKVGEDGKITCTHNDDPTFFDISFVTRPADRIAWNLKTASGEILDSIKIAEVEGVSVPDSIAISSPVALAKYALLQKMAECENLYAALTQRAPISTREYYVWELRKAATAKLDDATLTALRDYEPQDVFYHLAKAGTVMDAESFFKYALGSDYKEITEDMPLVKQAVKGICNALLQRDECQSVCNDTTFDSDLNAFTLLSIPHLSKTAEVTFVGPSMDQRVIEATINNVEITVDNITKISSNGDKTIVKLAERYTAYKLAAMQAISSLNKNTDTDALIAIATAQNLIG